MDTAACSIDGTSFPDGSMDWGSTKAILNINLSPQWQVATTDVDHGRAQKGATAASHNESHDEFPHKQHDSANQGHAFVVGNANI